MSPLVAAAVLAILAIPASAQPDPRLRTPMHWARGPAAGFTRGVAWEPLQPDSMTANVEAQDGDPNSLLNLHRRLIHLRGTNAALGGGELVPLTTSHEAVAAYLRRDGDRAALVIANLGSTALSGVTVASGDRTLPAARYSVTSLLGGPAGRQLRVASNGRIQGYAPLAALGGLEIHVFELSGVR